MEWLFIIPLVGSLFIVILGSGFLKKLGISVFVSIGSFIKSFVIVYVLIFAIVAFTGLKNGAFQ